MNAIVADDKIGYDPLHNLTSADQAYLWMDNYCKANPLKGVADGAADLFIEVQQKKK
ncbi:hypothetical protein QTI66_36050 [Variovorax sp. J22R133]|uniref:hypothetical protein n=1 Tax=Variovorax brevis TaxID=3053503 RepID=UPI002577272D|nr:hypothetical protein [Variovorax sp. J22R133]MDM0117529.1 hypothetical protein [Variovorax sp. J22R133]